MQNARRNSQQLHQRSVSFSLPASHTNKHKSGSTSMLSNILSLGSRHQRRSSYTAATGATSARNSALPTTNGSDHMAMAPVPNVSPNLPKRESVGHSRRVSSSSHGSKPSFDGFQFPPQRHEDNLHPSSELLAAYGDSSSADDDVVGRDPATDTVSFMNHPLPHRPSSSVHSGLPATVSSTPYGAGGGGATHPGPDNRRKSLSTLSPARGYQPNSNVGNNRRQQQQQQPQQQHLSRTSRSDPRHPRTSSSSTFKGSAQQYIGRGHPSGRSSQHPQSNGQQKGRRGSGKGGRLNHDAAAFVPSGFVDPSVSAPVFPSSSSDRNVPTMMNPAMPMNGLGNVLIYNHPPQSASLQPTYAHSPLHANGMAFPPLATGPGYQQRYQHSHYLAAKDVYGPSNSLNPSPMPISRAFPASPQIAGGAGSDVNYGRRMPVQAYDLANGVDLPYSTDTSTRFRGGIAHPYQGEMKYAAALLPGAVADPGSGSRAHARRPTHGSSYPLSPSESSSSSYSSISSSSSSSSRSPIHDVNHPYYDLANPEPPSPSFEPKHTLPSVLSTPFKYENNPLALARADIQAGQLYLKTQLEQLVDAIPQLNAHVRHCMTRTNSARLKITELRKELKRLYAQQRQDNTTTTTPHRHHHPRPLHPLGALTWMSDAAYLREAADYERKTQQVFDSVARGQATYHPKALAALGLSLTIVKQGRAARLHQVQQEQQQQQLERQKLDCREAKRQVKQSLDQWRGILEDAESREDEAKKALDRVRRRVRELEEGCSSTGDGSYSPGAEVRALADSMLTTL